MKIRHILPVLFLVGVFGVAVAGGQEALREPNPNWAAVAGGQARLQEPIPNWPAPSSWSPARPDEGLTTMGAITSPLPFIGITPCRVVDTRGAVGPYGGPALVGNGSARSFNIPAGPCPGIPSTAGAYSINVAAVAPASDGFMTVFPTGAAQPTSSDLNFLGGKVIANAIVAPAGTGGSIDVFVNVSTHMILDINGYYAGAGVGIHNTFLGLNAGNFTMTGDENTGLGHGALASNTTGDHNTATGNNALANNDMGIFNTASGTGALGSNTMGQRNTATGTGALGTNVLGSFNTATGSTALLNTTGSSNIGIGIGGGINLTTGSNNICIGNMGVAAESGTIRIGTVGTQSATLIAGISGATSSGGVGVFVNSSGQLGTMTSTRRVKEDIREIAEESDGLMKLRPVAFKYKPQIDPTGLAQYGLIAEEVADVYPDLVAYDRDGRPETVRYHLVNALLLNEVQKQHRTAEAQEKTIEQQNAEIEGLKARLSRLEARLLAESRP